MRLRMVRAPGEVAVPAEAGAREGEFASSTDGGKLVIPRRMDLERVGGWVVVPRRPELARGRLRQARTGEAGPPAEVGSREGGRLGGRPTAARCSRGGSLRSVDGGRWPSPQRVELGGGAGGSSSHVGRSSRGGDCVSVLGGASLSHLGLELARVGGWVVVPAPVRCT